MKQILLFLTIILALSCCGQDKDAFTKRVEQYFTKENIQFKPSQQNILIIPGGGCPGCIASGISFVKENQKAFSNKQEKNFIVFTGITSRKILYRRLNDIDLQNMNVIIDTNDRYKVDFEACEYPLVLYLSHGDIRKAESQSPESDALEHLTDELYK